MMSNLAQGFAVMRRVVAALNKDSSVPQDAALDVKLAEDFKLECKKFLLYRAHGLRDRQWCSIQRLRSLLVMFEEVRSHCGCLRGP